VKKYKFMTSALPTVTRYSLPHMKDIVDEYLKFGFKHVRMRPLNIAGMAIETWKKIGYTAEEFINSWKEYFDYLLTLNKKGINIFDEDVVFILKKITASESALYTCLGAPCGACLLQAGYNQWGDIYTCDEARSNEIFKLGNVKEKNYKEIFTSKHALNFIGLTSCICSACDDCVWHPYCSPCLVSTYGGQKNIIPKLPLDFLCKIRRSQIEIIFKKLILDKDNKKIFLKLMSDKRI
jgi:radical SAM protein with 4Fe4S-binding SPASM domain